MSLLLLRHVHAGDRGASSGPDRLRPLSMAGLGQAVALVDAYADRQLVAIVSSPFTRCVQSVEPLAAACGLPIEEVEELAEGTPLDVASRFLRAQVRRAERSGGDVVACSHGDVIGSVVQHLLDQGLVPPAGGVRWQKASTWVLDGDLDDPTVAYLPPPA